MGSLGLAWYAALYMGYSLEGKSLQGSCETCPKWLAKLINLFNHGDLICGWGGLLIQDLLPQYFFARDPPDLRRASSSVILFLFGHVQGRDAYPKVPTLPCDHRLDSFPHCYC